MIGILMAAALAASGDPLRPILNEMAAGAGPTSADFVDSALKSSSDLTGQLEAAATSGSLKAIVIGPAPGRFGAFNQQGALHISQAFMAEQTPASGDRTLALENMVFVLGYEASKLDAAEGNARADAQSREDVKRLAASTPKGSPLDVTSLVQAGMQSHIADEARAYLQGWNDEIEAATTTKGAPLTPTEVFQLLRNGRNTKPVLAAALLPADQRLEPDGRLRFPLNSRNLNAMISVLGASAVPDFN